MHIIQKLMNKLWITHVTTGEFLLHVNASKPATVAGIDVMEPSLEKMDGADTKTF